MRRSRNRHGVITVLISLLLAGILSIGTLSIELGRYQAAKTQLNDANISAGTSMIAGYHAGLYERYGLLSIDQAACNPSRYAQYLRFNSDLAPGYKGNNISTLYTLTNMELQTYYPLTSSGVLKRQILCRSKYHIIPQNYSLNYYNVNSFWNDMLLKIDYLIDVIRSSANGTAAVGTLEDIPEDVKLAMEVLHRQFKLRIQKADQNCAVKIDPSSVNLLPSNHPYTGASIPQEDLNKIQNTILKTQSVLGSEGALLRHGGGEVYSETDVTLDVGCMTTLMERLSLLENLPRTSKEISKEALDLLLQMKAAINVLITQETEENLLLNTYIAEFFPNRNTTVEGYNGPAAGTVSGSTLTFSSAATEYIFGGSASEEDNQKVANRYVIAIRMVNNLYDTMINSDCLNENSSISVASHIAWGYYESCADMHLLAQYNATVPLNKYNMMFSMKNAQQISAAFSEMNEEAFLAGMKTLGIFDGEKFIIEGSDQTNYRDALAIAAWFVPNTKKLQAVADLIQLEMRYTEQYVLGQTPAFLLENQNTFVRVGCEARLNPVLPVISMGSGSQLGDIQFQSVRYIGY